MPICYLVKKSQQHQSAIPETILASCMRRIHRQHRTTEQKNLFDDNYLRSILVEYLPIQISDQVSNQQSIHNTASKKRMQAYLS